MKAADNSEFVIGFPVQKGLNAETCKHLPVQPKPVLIMYTGLPYQYRTAFPENLFAAGGNGFGYPNKIVRSL